jgi:urease accessory protein
MPTAPPTAMDNPQALLKLMQLVSPALPVGAYSYSEGLETLVQQGAIADADALIPWLHHELTFGLVRVDGVLLAQAHRAATTEDWSTVAWVNQQSSALRDSEEMRQQSWTMGRALVRMATQLDPDLAPSLVAAGNPCNFAVAFALLAARWDIDAPTTVLGYLHSWATNLITAAVKLVPLGQTVGQQILLGLGPVLEATAQSCVTQDPEDITLSSWGTSLASMNHETLYTRLFRS